MAQHAMWGAHAGAWSRARIADEGERVWPFCVDSNKFAANLGLANSMGLFLQKTNIIRDYLEDVASALEALLTPPMREAGTCGLAARLACGRAL